MSPAALLALAAAWAISAAGAAWLGWDYRDAKVAQEAQDVAKAYADWAEDRQDKADKLATELSTARATQAPREKLITKEVTRYVQVTPADQRCTLPGTWRVRHDAAATGTPLDTSRPVLLGTAGEVDDAAALETVADNYAAARECADKLTYWQRRYREIEANREAAR